jgi:cell division protein FtsA
MIKQRSNHIAILDIGNAKILCLVAKVGTNKEIEVVGFSQNSSDGVKAGVIVDLQVTVNCIIQAIEDAERDSGIRIKNVYTNLSSNNILSHQLSSEVDVTGHEINAKDLNKLLLQIVDRYKNQQLSLVHSFTYDYVLDGNRGITNPLGMYGSNLSCDANILLSPSNTLANLTNCLAKCQLDVSGYIASAYASGIACLSKDEMQMGVVLIELGAGCSSISLFNNGQMIFTDGIPLGGLNITSDIAKGLSIPFETAERIKILYGNAISTAVDKGIIELQDEDGGNDKDENTNVSFVTLSEIIRARAEEILELLMHKITNIGLPVVGHKIVLTGGGSNLSGMRELVSTMFSSKVRIGNAKQIDGLTEENKDLGFSTAIGMILHVTSSVHQPHYNAGTEDHVGKKVWKWVKDNLI